MDIIEFVGSYGPWAWIVGGLVLLGIELMVPGGIFVWLGAAALITGIFTLMLPFGWPIQWALFGILALVSIAGWLRFYKNPKEVETDRPNLNRRAERLVGQELVLADAIEAGYGRAMVADSVWRVSGPNLEKGSKVRVVGHDGAVLKVETINPV